MVNEYDIAKFASILYRKKYRCKIDGRVRKWQKLEVKPRSSWSLQYWSALSPNDVTKLREDLIYDLHYYYYKYAAYLRNLGNWDENRTKLYKCYDVIRKLRDIRFGDKLIRTLEHFLRAK